MTLFGFLFAVLCVITAYGVDSAVAADCAPFVADLNTCLPYISTGSTLPTPERSCCSGMQAAMGKDNDCICETLNANPSQVDMVREASLTTACASQGFSITFACSYSSSSSSPPAPSGEPSASPTVSPALPSPEAPAATAPSPSVTTPVAPAATVPSPSVTTPVAPAATVPSPSVTTPVAPAATVPSPSVTTPVAPAATVPSPSVTNPVAPAATVPSPSVTTPVAPVATVPPSAPSMESPERSETIRLKVWLTTGLVGLVGIIA